MSKHSCFMLTSVLNSLIKSVTETTSLPPQEKQGSASESPGHSRVEENFFIHNSETVNAQVAHN